MEYLTSNDRSQCGYEEKRHVDCSREDAADAGYGSLSGSQSPGSNACPVCQPVALLQRFVFQLFYVPHARLTGNARACRELLSSYAASASAQARRSSPHLSPDETFINHEQPSRVPRMTTRTGASRTAQTLHTIQIQSHTNVCGLLWPRGRGADGSSSYFDRAWSASRRRAGTVSAGDLRGPDAISRVD
jgi:hypothetical protein